MQFPLTLTASFLKRSYARRLFHGWWKIAFGAVMIGVAVTSDARDGELGGTSIFGLSVLGLYFLTVGVAWFRRSRAVDDWIRRQAGAPVIYTLTEETLEGSSEIGSTKLKWEAFHSLAISDFDTRLAFPHHSGALTLPTDQIPGEALEFLKQQFLSHGKKIEDKRKQGVAGRSAEQPDIKTN